MNGVAYNGSMEQQLQIVQAIRFLEGSDGNISIQEAPFVCSVTLK
jgi:hypothetical protein